MLLSTLSFSSEHNLSIYNEQVFYTLGLVAQNPGQKYITFINDIKYLSKLNENVSVVITKPELKEIIPKKYGIVVSENPTITFFELQNYLSLNTDYIRKSEDTVIGKNCKISSLVSIAKENVVIGNNVEIEDFVTIYPNTTIGDNVIIRSGSKIGGQGFEYKRCPDNTILTVKHYGGVVIEHDVDVHCNVCIDCAVYPWDNTVIGEYTKIDNLVHIAHAVKIGKRNLITASACIGGRTEIGDDCWIGIGAIIKNAVSVKNKATITMGSVLANNVRENEEVGGFYAVRHEDFLMSQYKIRKLK